jgi:excisionase family DNA binding protein
MARGRLKCPAASPEEPEGWVGTNAMATRQRRAQVRLSDRDDPRISGELLTVAEVARELKLTSRGVRYLIYQNRLAAYRMGPRRLRVTKEALETFRRTMLQAV